MKFIILCIILISINCKVDKYMKLNMKVKNVSSGQIDSNEKPDQLVENKNSKTQEQLQQQTSQAAQKSLNQDQAVAQDNFQEPEIVDAQQFQNAENLQAIKNKQFALVNSSSDASKNQIDDKNAQQLTFRLAESQKDQNLNKNQNQFVNGYSSPTYSMPVFTSQQLPPIHEFVTHDMPVAQSFSSTCPCSANMPTICPRCTGQPDQQTILQVTSLLTCDCVQKPACQICPELYEAIHAAELRRAFSDEQNELSLKSRADKQSQLYQKGQLIAKQIQNAEHQALQAAKAMNANARVALAYRAQLNDINAQAEALLHTHVLVQDTLGNMQIHQVYHQPPENVGDYDEHQVVSHDLYQEIPQQIPSYQQISYQPTPLVISHVEPIPNPGAQSYISQTVENFPQQAEAIMNDRDQMLHDSYHIGEETQTQQQPEMVNAQKESFQNIDVSKSQPQDFNQMIRFNEVKEKDLNKGNSSKNLIANLQKQALNMIKKQIPQKMKKKLRLKN